MTEKFIINRFLARLSTMGYIYKSVDEIFKEESLEAEIVSQILVFLPDILKMDIGTGVQLLRSLISAKESFDAFPLIDLFENSDYNSIIKSTIGHVLSVGNTNDISNWIINQLLHKSSAFERVSLLRGLVLKAGLKEREELMAVLQQIFEKYILYELYQKVYNWFGIKSDILFLKQKLEGLDNNVQLADVRKIRRRQLTDENMMFLDSALKLADRDLRKEILKMIKTIEKRKLDHRFPVVTFDL